MTTVNIKVTIIVIRLIWQQPTAGIGEKVTDQSISSFL